jgi:cytochrome c-type biogenesis protein CcmH
MLWIVFAVLTFATLAALLWPLLGASGPAANRADYDIAVYRAQLAELETDAARGLLQPGSAAVATLEIQRRMLGAEPAPAPADDWRARRTAAIVIAVVVPLCTALLYVSLGHPRLSGQPYAERLEHDPAVILADAAAKLETALAAKPTIAGYRRLAELYVRIDDFERASAAQKHVLALGADSADDWADLGDIAVNAAQGAVGPDALVAFAQALSRDAREPRARFYAGLAEAEIGNLKAAIAIWRDLEQDSQPDAPWLPLLRREIETVAKAGKFDPATISPAPPSPATLTAAVDAMQRAMNR